MPIRGAEEFAACGKSHPCTFSTWVNGGNAAACHGRHSAHPALRHFIHRLVALALCGAGVDLPAMPLAGDADQPVAAGVASGVEAAESELARQPTWSIPTREAVERQLAEWIAHAPASVADRQRAAEVWDERSAAPGSDLLDAVVATLAVADPRVAGVLAAAAAESAEGSAAATLWWADPATDPWERDAVKLWLGREWVRLERYDEGLAIIGELDPATAIDPASLFFHRAACQHWLLKGDLALESLERLLERAGEIPVRYEQVARLLRADIKSLEDESLDHIARRMRDITRRLGLGRAGPGTRQVQDGVIESLDKMIAAIEKQQESQAGSAGGAGTGKGGNGKPMDDSRLADGKGPGDVTPRDIGDSGGWGNLPPHQREEALQQIGREYPAHYREAIEQYFKRLATGELFLLNQSPLSGIRFLESEGNPTNVSQTG